MFYWSKQKNPRGDGAKVLDFHSILTLSLEYHVTYPISPINWRILSLLFQSMGCPKISALLWSHREKSQKARSAAFEWVTCISETPGWVMAIPWASGLFSLALCIFLPNSHYLCVYPCRWEGWRETAKGKRKTMNRLTCGCGEIPQFCLQVHLAEVCTYFSLSVLCLMPHQNPQSRLQRDRGRTFGPCG